MLICVTTSYGAEISFNERGLLTFRGTITKGDHQKLVKMIRQQPAKFSGVIMKIDSDGGDVLEAIKIGQIVKDLYFMILNDDGQCASACFFIYVSSPSRLAADLGIHRPYFDKSEFSNMSADEAQRRYGELTSNIKKFLNKNQVPTYLAEKMFSLSSDEIYWLTDFDKEQLGIRPPWFDQYMVSKCGFNSNALLQTAMLAQQGSASAQSQYDSWESCELKVTVKESQKNIMKYLH
jgi:hypothetical protein